MIVEGGTRKELWNDGQGCMVSLWIDGNVLGAGERAQWIRFLAHEESEFKFSAST